ncbi:MAG TPA: hypothetical protein VF027_07330 [Sphingomicrobium sp.]
MTRKTVFLGIALAALATAPAAADRNAQSGATVGDCISDGFYGNEPNMADGSLGGPAEQQPGTQAGNVLASQSPGPFVTNPITGEVTRGNSIGYYNSQGINIPALCREFLEGS